MSLLLAVLLFASGPTVALEARGRSDGSPGGKEDGDADRLYRMARTDLAKRLGIEEGRVKRVSVEPRTWPDASLGCPKPDTMYAQVETPGYLIDLEAAGKKYAYHSDHKRVVHCE
jgi:hypothetical protein